MSKRSYWVRQECVLQVKSAYERRYGRQEDLAKDVEVSPDTASKFLNGKKVSRENFRKLCDQLELEWEAIAHLSEEVEPQGSVVTPPQEQPCATEQTIPCSAYDKETWVGREELLRQLNEKLRGKCRILIVTGVTGQGKTTLAERLATAELRDYWQQYKCLNFDDISMRDFASAADELLTQLGEEVTADERKDAERLLNRLVPKLRNNRYLVQLDSLEVLLKGQGDDDTARNEFQDERWWEFLNRLLASQDCQSRLILTSQDLPTQFRGCKSRTLWTEEPLGGLDEKEQFELFQKLFEQKGKEVEPESEAAEYLKRMGNAYEGHPLVIEVIAGEILNRPFNGNVVAYWQKYCQEFEAIEAVVGHQELQLQVKDRVRKSLERLEQDVPYAYALLLRSSVYRRRVPEPFWLEMLWSLTAEEKAAALRTLESRYLVFAEGVTHTGQVLLRQHNLIRNVAYELLKQLSNQGLEWQDNHYTAAKMWCTAYEPEPDTSNLEQVRGYLEAFHHLCEVKDWEGASKILAIHLYTPTHNELHAQLGIWGYYRERIELYSRLIYKLNFRCDFVCLIGLGNVYFAQGNYVYALDYYQQDLAIARKIGDKAEQGAALCSIGNVYFAQGDYACALDYYQQYLAIAREIGDKAEQGAALCGLGNVCSVQGDYTCALDYYQQYLAIAQKLGNKLEEGGALGNLGNVYSDQGDYTRALDCYQLQLSIVQELGNKFEEGVVLGNLGNVYRCLRDDARAFDYYRQGLVIAKDIGDRSTEARTLYNLAALHQKLGNRQLAIEFCDPALALATDLGIPLVKECQELKEKLLKEET